MPIPFALIAAAAPSIIKGASGLMQMNKADDVKKRNTTPEAFLEQLAMSRQLANAGHMPGEAAAVTRIAQQTSGIDAASRRAGASSSDVLAALASSDARQQQALAGLTTASEQFHERQQGQLRQDLGQQAAYQSADQQAFEREKAALKESGAQNAFSGAEGLSQVAAYGLSKGEDSSSGYGGFGGMGEGSPAGDYEMFPRRRRSMFGQYVPAGLMG